MPHLESPRSPSTRRHTSVGLTGDQKLLIRKIDSMHDEERQDLADRLLAWEALVSPMPEKPQLRNRISVSTSSPTRGNRNSKYLKSPTRRASLNDFELRGATMSAPASKKKSLRDLMKLAGNNNPRTRGQERTFKSGRRASLFGFPRKGQAMHNPRQSNSLLSMPDLNDSEADIDDIEKRCPAPKSPRKKMDLPRQSTKPLGKGSRHSTLSRKEQHLDSKVLKHDAGHSSFTDGPDPAEMQRATSKSPNSLKDQSRSPRKRKSKIARRRHVDASLAQFLTDDDDRFSTSISSSLVDSPGAARVEGVEMNERGYSFHQSLKGSVTGPTAKKKSVRDFFSKRKSADKRSSGRNHKTLGLPEIGLGGAEDEIDKGNGGQPESRPARRRTGGKRGSGHASISAGLPRPPL